MLEKHEKLAIHKKGDLLKKFSFRNNFRIIEGLEIYENLVMEENQQLYKDISVSNKKTSINNIDTDRYKRK